LDDAEREKQKALEAVEHQKDLAVEKEEKEKQRVLTYSASIGMVLVIFFLIFVFNRLKITRKQKEAIDEQKQVIEKTHEQLEEHHKEISDSINYAKSLQKAILPSKEELYKELIDGFVLFQPKNVVSGDFYWMEKLGDQVFFAVADCTGHGVPGAMVSVVCSNALDRAVHEFGHLDTGKILDKATDIVIERFEKSGEEVRDGMDIAICALNRKTNELQYSGANNPLWIIRENDGKQQFSDKDIYTENKYFVEVKASSQPVGKYERRKPFEATTLKLNKGDVLYVFTDGFADQFGGKKGKKFKYKPFKKLLFDIVDLPMGDQKNVIFKTFNDWKGDLEQIDDVCIIGVKI